MTDTEDCQQKQNNDTPSGGVSEPLIELARATFEPVKAENYRRTEAAWRAVDANRKEDEGKETYNAKRKREYAEAMGRPVRAYRVPDSEAKKGKRTAANTKRMWDKRHPAVQASPVADTLSDDDVSWLADNG